MFLSVILFGIAFGPMPVATANQKSVYSIGDAGPDFSGRAGVGRTADVFDVPLVILSDGRRLFPRAAVSAEPHLLARHSRRQ